MPFADILAISGEVKHRCLKRRIVFVILYGFGNREVWIGYIWSMVTARGRVWAIIIDDNIIFLSRKELKIAVRMDYLFPVMGYLVLQLELTSLSVF